MNANDMDNKEMNQGESSQSNSQLSNKRGSYSIIRDLVPTREH